VVDRIVVETIHQRSRLGQHIADPLDFLGKVHLGGALVGEQTQLLGLGLAHGHRVVGLVPLFLLDVVLRLCDIQVALVVAGVEQHHRFVIPRHSLLVVTQF